MINFNIQIPNLKGMKAATKAIYNQFKWYQNTGAFNKLCAEEYVRMLKEAIITQKYGSTYAKYSPGYEKWKQSKTPSQSFWVLYGDLLSAIAVARLRSQAPGTYFGGVMGYKRDQGNKSYGKGKKRAIAWYGGIAEVGGTFVDKNGRIQRHPPRALFEPTADEFAAQGWRLIGKRTVDSLGVLWTWKL